VLTYNLRDTCNTSDENQRTSFKQHYLTNHVTVVFDDAN